MRLRQSRKIYRLAYYFKTVIEKIIRILLPVLGIVFGSGVGMLASMLYSFHVTAGIICGAAAG